MTSPAQQLRPLLVGLFLSLIFLGGTGCVGWGSSALPPRLTKAEQARVRTAHLPLTVGVEPYQYPAYSEALRDALQRTKLFDRVDALDQFSEPPALIARVEEQIYGSTIIPVYTLLTFGLFPTSVQETSGLSFSLTPPNRPEERVPIQYTHRGRTTLGWVALLDVFHPNRTIVPFNPEHSRRFLDRLRLAILEQEEAIKRYAAPGKTGGSGYQPEPPGHWPGGTSGVCWVRAAFTRSRGVSAVPSGGSPDGTGW